MSITRAVVSKACHSEGFKKILLAILWLLQMADGFFLILEITKWEWNILLLLRRICNLL